MWVRFGGQKSYQCSTYMDTLTLPNLIYTMGTNDLILNFKNTFVFKRLNTGNIQKPLAHREEQA